MLIGPLLVCALAVGAYVLPRRSMNDADAHRFGLLLLLGYAARFATHLILRNVTLFSHGRASEGDAGVYEMAAWGVARLWQIQGFSWVTADQLEMRGASNAMLAVHSYAAIIYANGGEPTRMGCLAFNAFLACATCLQLYRLGRMIGGNETESRFVALAMFFGPGYLFHTADLFKDGLSAFLVVSAVTIAFRLSERLNPLDMFLGLLCLWGLWYVRFYLVFLVSAPLALSLLGVRSGVAARVVIAGVVVVAMAMALIQTQFAEDAMDLGMSTYEVATASNTLEYNARGGSGVVFDSGNPWVSFPLKLLYTLFSPFPWDFRSTSIGFQLGKLDALLWYYMLWRGLRAAKRMWRDDRGTLLMFLIVLVPLTVAYATTMANIGLIVRQRIPIVMLASVLAVRGRKDEESAAAEPNAIVASGTA